MGLFQHFRTGQQTEVVIAAWYIYIPHQVTRMTLSWKSSEVVETSAVSGGIPPIASGQTLEWLSSNTSEQNAAR